MHAYEAAAAFNHMSAIFGCVVLVTLLAIGIYNKEFLTRTSLRLQAAIAVSDIINHTVGLRYAYLKAGPECVAAGFFRMFGRDLFCFYNIAIALNLQLVLLNGVQVTPKIELFYWLGPLVVALIMNIPPLALDMFGRGPGDHVCYLKTKAPGSAILGLINVNLVIFVTIIYCSVVSVLVILRLNSHLRNLNPSLQGNADVVETSEKMSHVKKELKKLITRVSLYPIACFLGLFGYAVNQVNTYANPSDYNPDLINWSLLLSNLAGTLNFIAFLFDPTLHHALRCMFTSKDAKNYKNSGDKNMPAGPGGLQLDSLNVQDHKEVKDVEGQNLTYYNIHDDEEYKSFIKKY